MATNNLQTEGGRQCLSAHLAETQPRWSRPPASWGSAEWAPRSCQKTYPGLDSARSVGISPTLKYSPKGGLQQKQENEKGCYQAHSKHLPQLLPSQTVCAALPPGKGARLQIDKPRWLQTPFLRSWHSASCKQAGDRSAASMKRKPSIHQMVSIPPC